MILFKNKMQNRIQVLEHLDKFLSLYKKDTEKIFEEIYTYLGEQKFLSKESFIKNYIQLLSQEKNKTKKLSNGLLLKSAFPSNILFLTDINSTFKVKIEFINKITIKKSDGKTKYKFIVSKDYYNKTIKKKYHVKAQYINNLSESSLESEELDEKVIYNKNFDYLSIIPNYSNIYEKIFMIFRDEKVKIDLSPNDFYNEFRLLNFPEIHKEDVGKINWKGNFIEEKSSKYKFFIYNPKIGISLYIQHMLHDLLRRNEKYFYLNIDFLFNEVSNKSIKQYIFYYLSTLYTENDYEEYVNFIEKNILDIINYKGEKLLQSLLNILTNNFVNFFLCFDNIKTKKEFDVAKTFVDSYNVDFASFIEINKSTLDCLKDINYLFIYNITENNDISSDIAYYLPLTLGKINMDKIKESFSEKLKLYFEKIDFESYRYLLKIKYFLHSNNFDINDLKDYASFLEFLLISKMKKKVVTKIKFRNNIIRELFNDMYELYVIKIKNTNNNIINEFSKSSEGIYFEKQIIYDVIVNNTKINKIKIDKIFSVNSFNDFEKNSTNEYLVIQTRDNAPYYDFGYLYKELNLNILKVFQIGINKGYKELIKLNKNFLLFDLYYFSQRIFKEKGILIDAIELCLITTYKAYEESLNTTIEKKDRIYNNFEDMKNYCKENDFLFLIYDVKNSEYFRFDENDNLIKTNLKFTSYRSKVIKIFKNDNDIEGTKKLNFYFKIKNPLIMGKIKKNKNFSKEKINEFFEIEIKKKNVIFYNRENKIMDIDDVSQIEDEIGFEEEASDEIEDEESVKSNIYQENNENIGLEESNESIIEEKYFEKEDEGEGDKKEEENDKNKFIKKRKRSQNGNEDFNEKSNKKNK